MLSQQHSHNTIHLCNYYSHLNALDPQLCLNAHITIQDSGDGINEIAAVMNYGNTLRTETKLRNIMVVRRDGKNQSMSTVICGSLWHTLCSSLMAHWAGVLQAPHVKLNKEDSTCHPKNGLMTIRPTDKSYTIALDFCETIDFIFSVGSQMNMQSTCSVVIWRPD